MGRCIFNECRWRPLPKSGRMLSYHSFPRIPSIMPKWVKWVRDVCGMYNFVLLPSSSSLCCRHFADGCFRRSGRLRPDVLPTITPYDLDEAEIADSTGCCDVVRDETGKLGARTMPPTSMENARTTGDQPEIFFEKCHEVTDVIVEVQGNGEGSIPIPSSEVKKKFPIDLSLDDFTNCQKAKRNLNILNTALSKTKNRLQNQGDRIRRVTRSVIGIRRLIQSLRNAEMVTKEGQLELETAVNNILDNINFKKHC